MTACATFAAHARRKERQMIKQVLAFFFALGIASAPSLAHAQDKSIIVFAAASLKNALDEVNAAFTKATGIKTVASYAASSALMKQIENGAPAAIARGEGRIRGGWLYFPPEADVVSAASLSWPAKAGNPVINDPAQRMQAPACGEYSMLRFRGA